MIRPHNLIITRVIIARFQFLVQASGENFKKLIRENRDCTTVPLFSMFDGDLTLCQIFFSDSGHSSHMALQTADKRTCYLLVTVKEHGVTDKALLAA